MLDALILSSANTHSTSHKLVVRATSNLNSNQTSEEFSGDSIEPRRRFVKPRKKKGLQWSKGTAPGEYGGPPTYINPRKMWGGENIDPITSKTDYIWNKQWMEFVQVTPAEPTKVESPKQEQEAGFLSLSRAMALDSLDVDLSQDLMQPSVSILEQQVEAARFGISTDEAIKSDKPRWRMAPTLREQQKWERASKAETGGTGMLMRNINRNREDPAVIAAETKRQYNQLKQRLQFLTLAVGGVGVLSAYVSYSPEVAASYSAGLLGSLAYLRMLGKSVDSYGVTGVKGAARKTLSSSQIRGHSPRVCPSYIDAQKILQISPQWFFGSRMMNLQVESADFAGMMLFLHKMVDTRPGYVGHTPKRGSRAATLICSSGLGHDV